MACVAGVRKGRGRELGREAREEGRVSGSFPFSLARPNSPFPLLTPATLLGFSTIRKAPTTRRKKDYRPCAPSRCRL